MSGIECELVFIHGLPYVALITTTTAFISYYIQVL